MRFLSRFFQGGIDGGRQVGNEEVPIQIVDVYRVIEKLSGNLDLGIAIFEYYALAEGISRGGRAGNDSQLLAEKAERIKEVLAQHGMELEKEPSPLNAQVDDSVSLFVQLYTEINGQPAEEQRTRVG